ncbi:MAG: NusA N-terminal domain-containing protein [Metamycoplasmataceae bacterium]
MASKWKINELNKIFKHVEAKNEITIELLKRLLLNALTRVIQSDIDPEVELDLIIDENKGMQLISKNKIVVEDNFYNEDYEKNETVSIFSIPLSKAKEINSKIKVGDEIEEEINFEDFSVSLNTKILNSFKYEIIKNKREKIFNEYRNKIGEEVKVKLITEDPRGVSFLLEDGNECFMPLRYWNPNIPLNNLNTLVIEEVIEAPDKINRSQILVSNSSISRLKSLFEIEIPEIQSGIIEIVSIARIPGIRSKISFKQSPEHLGQLDVLGCVIGDRGSRINAISEKLGGERFDVVLYSDIPEEYISNAISPSRAVSINKRLKDDDFLIVVPNKHFTLAIGKKGQNVKLAVELTKKNIDICSYSEAIESNIEIKWNGNIQNIEELTMIENTEGRSPRRINSSNRNNNNNNNKYSFNKIDLENFEKEIADYQDEINNFESNFDFGNELNFNQDSKQKNDNLNKNNIQNNKDDEQFWSQHEVKKVNENFNVDEDLLEDMEIDFDDIDFSDFEDEEK